MIQKILLSSELKAPDSHEFWVWTELLAQINPNLDEIQLFVITSIWIVHSVWNLLDVWLLVILSDFQAQKAPILHSLVFYSSGFFSSKTLRNKQIFPVVPSSELRTANLELGIGNKLHLGLGGLQCSCGLHPKTKIENSRNGNFQLFWTKIP